MMRTIASQLHFFFATRARGFSKNIVLAAKKRCCRQQMASSCCRQPHLALLMQQMPQKFILCH
jgi:hypothetical protein